MSEFTVVMWAIWSLGTIALTVTIWRWQRPGPNSRGYLILFVIGAGIASFVTTAIVGVASRGYFERRERTHAFEAMARMGNGVPDERYFRLLVDRYREIVQPIDRNLRGSHEPLLSVARGSTGLYTMKLDADLRGIGDSDYVMEDIAIAADRESSALMAMVLELAESRAVRVEQILYSATGVDDSGAQVAYEASLTPGGNYSPRKYPNAQNFVTANKQVFRNTASGKVWTLR